MTRGDVEESKAIFITERGWHWQVEKLRAHPGPGGNRPIRVADRMAVAHHRLVCRNLGQRGFVRLWNPFPHNDAIGQNRTLGYAFRIDDDSHVVARMHADVHDSIVAPPQARAATARAARPIASRQRSTSASVVAQDDTLMRIAVRPCHTVPPHQHVPSS